MGAWCTYTNFQTIDATGGTADVAVSLTAAVYVATTGLVVVQDQNGDLVNFGTVAAGTVLPLAIVNVDSTNVAALIALR